MAIGHSTSATNPPASDNTYTRLHITPFTPALLSTIIPPSILPSAKNISYHTLQTFPEKGFGFVDLPAMDADRLKKKLNGSILKGSKMRVETAQPAKQLGGSAPADPEEEERAERKRRKKELKNAMKAEAEIMGKKRKRDETIPGVELKERKVKRGWTEPAAASTSAKDAKRGKDKKDKKDKKVAVKSKFTAGAECLFKTKLPANIAAASAEVTKSKREKMSKKSKEVVVHEFEKTTKHATFLRDSGVASGKGVSEYVEGKGWVDTYGNVVENAPVKKRVSGVEQKVEAEPSEDSPSMSDTTNASSSDKEDDDQGDVTVEAPAADTTNKEVQEDSPTSSSGSSSEEDSEDDEDVSKKPAETISKIQEVANESETSSSGSSDDESTDSSQDESDEDEQPKTAESKAPRRPAPISRPPNLSLAIPPPTKKGKAPAAEVHPLEALYKKPKTGTDASQEPAFSFFGADEESTVEAHLTVPMTPFTQRDFEFRGIRSAAPTPDTAHANKVFKWPSPNRDEEGEGASQEAGPSQGTPSRKRSKLAADDDGDEVMEEEGSQAPTSDFQKWFWENRGEANRAWKKRRKTAAKEKKHLEGKKGSRH